MVTVGAGYTSSFLTSVLLNWGYHVTVADKLIFGGESLLGYWRHPNSRFVKGDVCDPDLFQVEGSKLKVGDLEPATFNGVVHPSAIVGFPACQAVGRQVAWRYNVEATQRVFLAAEVAGAGRFVFTSTYSNYGLSKDGQLVTEDSSLWLWCKSTCRELECVTMI